MDSAYAFGYFISGIIISVIFGFVCKAISSKRGMDGGFWWGFWLWVIGIIVVAVRPNDNTPVYESNPRPKSRQEEEKEILENGGWKCDCGTINYHYVTSCRCGKSKWDVEQRRYLEKLAIEEEIKQQKKAELLSAKEQYKEKTNIEQIKEYKELLDVGAITQEEFDAKKKQLLGL